MKIVLRKKPVIAIIILILVLVGVTWLMNRPGKPQSPNITPAVTAVVSYGEGGFMPETLKVKAGTTVVWKSDGAEQMRIVSNPHPEHTDLKGLDSKTTVSKGATYTYKFDKAGTFRYHNELEPEQNGTIIVE